MKIRNGFVSNSSSSSFLVVYEINYSDELKQFIQEEFGNYGLKTSEKYIINKDKVEKELQYNDINMEELDKPLKEDNYYILANRIAWSTEGDSEGDDCWLIDHIPNEYKNNIYSGEDEY